MGAMKRAFTRKMLGLDAVQPPGIWDHLKGLTNEEYRVRLKSQPKRTKREAAFDRQLGLFAE